MSETNAGSWKDQTEGGADFVRDDAIENETVTNDAVAGETVLPGRSPAEAVPISDEHDPQTEPEVELGDDDGESQPPR